MWWGAHDAFFMDFIDQNNVFLGKFFFLWFHNPILKYVGGDKILLLNIDEDKWSFFEFVGIQKDDMNCTGDFKLWWTGFMMMV